MHLDNEVSRVCAPAFNELSAVRIWPTVKENVYIKQYLPDYNQNQKSETDYLLNIMNTIFSSSDWVW